jgi:hypothetical protein
MDAEHRAERWPVSGPAEQNYLAASGDSRMTNRMRSCLVHEALEVSFTGLAPDCWPDRGSAMPVIYANRYRDTYYLHVAGTKTGNPRYWFFRDCDGDLVDAIPAGYEIYENPDAPRARFLLQTDLILPGLSHKPIYAFSANVG